MFPLRVETAAPTPVFNRTASHAVPRTPCEPEFAIDPSAVSLICPVGEGSGGVVFKARYNGAIVAAKLLQGIDTIAFEHRLLRHPNLLSIYGKAAHARGTVLLMEYVSGGNMRDWMEENPVPVVHARALQGDATHADMLSRLLLAKRTSTVLSLCLQVASGMACLHRNRIVHRDLKPENILLAPVDGEMTAKVADFGLSRELDECSGTALTSTNGIKGTPVYMSPEQWRRGAVSDKADVYAFGLVMLEALSGEPVHWLDCPEEFSTPQRREANKHKFFKWLRRSGRPCVPAASPSFPSTLRNIVCACVQPSPSDRPSFASLVASLQAVIDTPLDSEACADETALQPFCTPVVTAAPLPTVVASGCDAPVSATASLLSPTHSSTPSVVRVPSAQLMESLEPVAKSISPTPSAPTRVVQAFIPAPAREEKVVFHALDMPALPIKPSHCRSPHKQANKSAAVTFPPSPVSATPHPPRESPSSPKNGVPACVRSPTNRSTKPVLSDVNPAPRFAWSPASSAHFPVSSLPTPSNRMTFAPHTARAGE